MVKSLAAELGYWYRPTDLRSARHCGVNDIPVATRKALKKYRAALKASRRHKREQRRQQQRRRAYSVAISSSNGPTAAPVEAAILSFWL